MAGVREAGSRDARAAQAVAIDAGTSGARAVAVAIDAGTSGVRAVAVDMRGRVVGRVRRPYATHVPRRGWAEQEPDDWAERGAEALAALARNLAGRHEVVAIGLTGQCPTIAPFDRRGRPLGPGMMYSDNRAAGEAAEMLERVGARRLHLVTGHVAEAFHAGPKVLWLRRHRPEVFSATACFMQPRDVVARRLLGRAVTDETHANSTLFFDLRARAWSAELLGAFDLDPGVFPEVLPPWTIAGRLPATLAAELGLPRVPVVIGAADSQCAAFGAGVTCPGPVSEMAGATSCLNSSVAEPVAELQVSHYSHVVPGQFSTEVGLNTAGAAIEWGRRRLRFPAHAALEAAALRHRARAMRRRVGPAPLFLPYLSDGERFDVSLRGAMLGLSSQHDDDALAYATVEGVALAVRDRLGVLARAGCRLDELRCSGGGARHRLLAQVKADLLGVPVRRLRDDATAVGCALLAASAAGMAGEAAGAVQAVLDRADVVEPDPHWTGVEAARAAWFDAAMADPALHPGVA